MDEKEPTIIGEEIMIRCVARTQDLVEANRIADEYEAKGYTVNIVKKKRGDIALYEVWVKGEPKTLYAKK